MTYKDFRQSRAARYEEALKNVFFAFSRDKFDDELKERGLKIADVYEVGGGGFGTAEDLKKIKEAEKITNLELAGLISSSIDFLIEAFTFEANNLECGITGDYSSALEVLNLTYQDLNPKQRHAINKIINIMNNYEANV